MCSESDQCTAGLSDSAAMLGLFSGVVVAREQVVLEVTGSIPFPEKSLGRILEGGGSGSRRRLGLGVLNKSLNYQKRRSVAMISTRAQPLHQRAEAV